MLRRRAGKLLIVVIVGATAAGLLVPVAGAAPQHGPVPTVTGPVTGGKGAINLTAPGVQLAPGYVAEEYFLEGAATAYAPTKKLGTDGKWKVKPAGTAPYKTRIVVYRPANASAFDGTVFVEWLNVSAGFESAPDWGSAHTQMVRAGAAWVGVSAQSVGVQGGQSTIAGLPPGGLKAADPARYGSLSHPGDAYSYDIFTQAGRAVEGQAAVKPLDGLKVKRMIAMGESQSAFRMVTYVNAVNPLVHVYDGFLIHSRGASGAGLGSSKSYGISDAAVPKRTAIRPTDVPVLTFQTETDLQELGYLPATQADSKHFRLWEVAGTSHADAYTGLIGFNDTGNGAAELQLLDPTKADGGPLGCSEPINSGPAYAVLDAAVAHLERWVKDGTAPPEAPRLQAKQQGKKTLVLRDAHGNAKGGIRTPIVDVPVATVTGNTNPGGSFCSLFGTTKPFDAATLTALYPTHGQYVKAFDRAMKRTVAAGFMLKPEADGYRAAARSIPVPPAA